MADTPHPLDQDRRISASHGFPYLQFYRDIFDCVYVALNPFVVIPGTNPSSLIPATLRSELPPEPLPLDLVNKIAAEWRVIQSIDPSIISNAEKQHGQPISWESIRTASGFATIADVNRALLTNIGALNKAFKDDSGATQLSSHCGDHNIFLPGEDFIQPIMERPLAVLLKQLGHKQTILSDEFGRTKCLIPTETLIAEERVWKCAGIINFHARMIFPPDNSFLIFVPYDTFTTIICGHEQSLRKQQVDKTFEGFWANEQTADDWWITGEERLRMAPARNSQ